MRRLKHILLKMNAATTTFKELYEGAMYVKPLFDLSRRLDTVCMNIMNEGLDTVFSQHFTSCERFLEMPRKIDVCVAVNRMRYIGVE